MLSFTTLSDTMNDGITTPPRRNSNSSNSSSSNNNKGGSRIPETLQTVFIRSNRGQKVHQPPPQSVASKTFAARLGKSSSLVGFVMSSPTQQQRRRLRTVHQITSNTNITGSNSTSTNNIKCKSLNELRPVPLSAVIGPGDGHVSPHAYITSVLKNRGYSTNEYPTLTTAYHNKPTLVQLASYGQYFVRSVRMNDVVMVTELLELGLSSNACNIHSESIVHTVCRLGNVEVLKVLMDFGCRVSVADAHGRTPFHDACAKATPDNFEIVELLLQQDPHLLYMKDARGFLPLEYVPRNQWTEWTRFFMAVKDKIWPQRDLETEGFKGDPDLTQQGANTKPILPTSSTGLSMEIIRMVADGTMDPFEASYCKFERDANLEATCDESFSDSSRTEDDQEVEEVVEVHDTKIAEDEDDDEDASSVYTFDEAEMAEILGSIGSMKPVAWSSKNSIELPNP